MAQSSFLQMPLHLISLVLSELDNVQSLRSAILTHSSLYAAFNESPKTVLSRILFNQITPDLIPLASITYEATQHGYRSTTSIRRLFSHFCNEWGSAMGYLYQQEYLESKLEDRKSWLAFVSSLSRTHMLVEHFTHQYLTDTLPLAARDLFGQNPTDTKRTSDNELYRIRRAFYRFQLYCNLTCKYDNNQNSAYGSRVRNYKSKLFFSHFSPWVNEQLACIHDYLEGVLSKAFDEVAAHDIEWGAKSVDWVSRGKDNKCKQAYLSYGLDFLLKLDRASNYDERLQLLASKDLPCSTRGLAVDLSQQGTSYNNDSYPQWSEALGRWSTEDFAIVNKTGNNGPDALESEPYLIWRYVHWRHVVDNSVLYPTNRRLRLHGYVMWDAPRSKPYRKAFRNEIERMRKLGRADADADEPEGAREEMERSWAQRAEVLSRGGRGYWAPGDLSRVVWDDGTDASGSDQVVSS